MPELPEVEAVRRALAPVLDGARFAAVIARRANLRTPFPGDFAARLEGRRVHGVSRRGKYLLLPLSSGDTLVMHLGMTGSFRVERPQGDVAGARFAGGDEARPHDHVVFALDSGAVIVFNDPRRFGFMNLVPPGRLGSDPALARLGPEPLSADFDAESLARACRGRKTSLKAALSDQRVVAGLGNIYASEALHRASLSPRRRASTIATPAGAPRAAACRLAAAVKHVLHEAIARSERAERRHPGAADPSGYFPMRFRVYDREGARCPRRSCRGVIRRIVQGGRSTFFCPVCQR